MECKKCSGFNDIKDILNSSCVGTAIEVIKTHFDLFKKICEDRGKEIELLVERNERLSKAVDFLERFKKKENERKKENKRRKKNLQGDYTPQKNIFGRDSGENSVCSDMTSSPGRSTDLNLALNMDTSTSSSLTQDETIAETEKVNSPRKHSLWSAKSRLLQQQNANNNCENVKANTRLTPPNSSNWMGKDQIFVEPKKSSSILAEKKLNLSFNRKPDRMKQTRLVFDVKKTNDKGCPEREVIAESPNLYSSLRQAKHSRSLMLRTGNSNSSGGNSSKAKNQHKSSKDIITFNDFGDFDDDQEENSDHFFDFNETKRPAAKLVSFKSSEGTGNKEKEQTSFASQNSDTSSVVMLTPATPDVIFVDDSHIGTMDLLDDNQDQLMLNLKRFEAKSIDKQKATNQLRKTKTVDAFAMESNAPAKIKNEPITQDLNRDNETTMLPEEYFMEFNDKPQQNEDSFDDEFVQPIIVKRESDIPTNKSILKQRFNVTCDKCIEFLDFFANNLTDRQIENHLRNCKHKKDQERLGHVTPPGFWNPLMESFAEDDPRREVFIDTRFVDKKKNK